MQEGRIVRGPGGRRGIIQNGRIVPLSVAQRDGGLEMIVPPKPKEPTPQTPAQAQQDALGVENTRLQMENTRQQMADRQQEKADKDQKLNDQLSTATSDILRVVERMDRVAADANDNGGWFETGRSGAFMRSLPGWVSTGSAGYDIQRDLDLVGSNAAIETLMQMRRESPTGAGVGNVALGELQLMKDKYGTFDPNQGHETFLRNLAEGKMEFLDKLKRINPQAFDEYMKKGPLGVWLGKDGAVKVGTIRMDGAPPDPAIGEIEFLGFEEE